MQDRVKNEFLSVVLFVVKIHNLILSIPPVAGALTQIVCRNDEDILTSTYFAFFFNERPGLNERSF